MAHFTQRNSSGSYHGSPGPPRPAAAPVPGSTCCFPIFHFLSPPTKCKLHQYRDLCSLLNSKQPDWHIVDAQCLAHVDTVYVHSLCGAHRETGNHGYLWGGELGAGVGVGGNSSFTSLYSRRILSLQKVIIGPEIKELTEKAEEELVPGSGRRAPSSLPRPVPLERWGAITGLREAPGNDG